ncbi:hypothetical protein B7R21_02980 [Subtercola boreus]|uniref:HTH tetR-type domain-containing protein n=1 Tax=Subtercola boreus TaxID=120213 RepID=A0A3E0W1B8_9MICO|nr:TetR/AcrR family transcriptional regulator [Subtercola boreus]RFA15946.1 hypothetical protein B7R21_02980 [Subtercola boreus]
MTMAGVAEPQQERSRRSFAKVREASLQLLLERGAGFTLADVSATASVSIGSIYGRVGSKVNLLRLIQGEELDRIDAELAAEMSDAAEVDASFDDAVHAVVMAAVAPLVRNAALIRVFMTLADDAETAERGRESWEAERIAFCHALATVTESHGVAASAQTLDWCHELVYSVTARHLGFGLAIGGQPEAREIMPTDALEESLAETIRLVLRGAAEKV